MSHENLEAAGARVDQGGRPQKCEAVRCEGAMALGVAMMSTYRGDTPDFHGCEVVTTSPGGPGRLVGCWKCAVCGWSVSAT